MKIFFFLLGTCIGIPVFYGIYGASTYFIERLYGRNIVSFKYLIISYTPSMGWHKCNFTPICEIKMRKENDNEKDVAFAFIIEKIVQYIAGIVILIFAVAMYRLGIIPLWLSAFIRGISGWFGINLITTVIFLIIAVKVENQPLNKNYREIVKKMQDGVPFGEIEVPDLRTYSEGYDNQSIAKYQHLYFMNRVWNDDRKNIEYAVKSMEFCIGINYFENDRSYLQSQTEIYYDLLFYYSYIDISKIHAKRIFDIISPDLLADNDSNGYRTLAYYNYFILGNEISAEMCIKQGLELIGEFPIISQREYEKMLLMNLLKAFPDSLTYAQFIGDTQE